MSVGPTPSSAVLSSSVQTGAAVGAELASVNGSTSEGLGGGSGSELISALAPPAKLDQGFAVYYDLSSGGLRMVEPEIYVGTEKIVLAVSSLDLTNGTYYLELRKKKTSGDTKYTAKIVTSPALGDREVVLCFKICSITSKKVTQYYTGSLILAGIGGDVTIKAASDTNLTVETDDQTGVITLGVYYC